MTEQRYRPLSRRAAALCAVAAAIATVAGVGSVFVLLHSATATAWLPAEAAALVAHCDAERSSAQRHRCVLAAVARQAATRMAQR